MKPEDIVLDMEVIPQGSREYRCKVTSLPDSDGKVTVLYQGGATDDLNVKYLEPYEPEKDKEVALLVQEKINQSKASLDETFRLLKEARDLACGRNMTIFEMNSEKFISLSELINTMEDAGWCYSSFSCSFGY
jgi:hypothetical protein